MIYYCNPIHFKPYQVWFAKIRLANNFLYNLRNYPEEKKEEPGGSISTGFSITRRKATIMLNHLIPTKKGGITL